MQKNTSPSITEELMSRLDCVSIRLKHSVTPMQIFAWLQNFESVEHDLALQILEKVEFVTENELLEHTDNCFKGWLGANLSLEGSRILFNPVADYGKSGTLLSYYLKKSPSFAEFAKSNPNTFLPNEASLIKEIANASRTDKLNIVFYDDFMASGNTVVTYLKKVYTPFASDARIQTVSLLSPYIMVDSTKVLTSTFPGLKLFTAENRHPAFASRQSPFGSFANNLREFAYKYGSLIYKEHPLGYANVQALIVFPYGCPNNTLPILWYTRNNWQSIYPRHSTPKIEAARAFRKECAFLTCKKNSLNKVSLFSSGARKTKWKTIQFVTRTDFTIFTIIRLLRQRRDRATICQIIGISGKDYDESIKQAIAKGILDNSLKLTDQGLLDYNLKLTRCSAFNNSTSTVLQNDSEQLVYVPKTFEGES